MKDSCYYCITQYLQFLNCAPCLRMITVCREIANQAYKYLNQAKNMYSEVKQIIYLKSAKSEDSNNIFFNVSSAIITKYEIFFFIFSIFRVTVFQV